MNCMSCEYYLQRWLKTGYYNRCTMFYFEGFEPVKDCPYVDEEGNLTEEGKEIKKYYR